jgi:hypothetical protein
MTISVLKREEESGKISVIQEFDVKNLNLIFNPYLEWIVKLSIS